MWSEFWPRRSKKELLDCASEKVHWRRGWLSCQSPSVSWQSFAAFLPQTWRWYWRRFSHLKTVRYLGDLRMAKWEDRGPRVPEDIGWSYPVSSGIHSSKVIVAWEKGNPEFKSFGVLYSGKVQFFMIRLFFKNLSSEGGKGCVWSLDVNRRSKRGCTDLGVPRSWLWNIDSSARSLFGEGIPGSREVL